MSRPVIIVAGRHRPHEQLLLACSVLLGVTYLAFTPPSTSLSALLPRPVLLIWGAAMAVSGVAGLVGCWWRGERGLLLELGGLLMNSGALTLYVTALFTVAGWRALSAGVITSAWVLANLWRVGQTVRDLQSIRGSA